MFEVRIFNTESIYQETSNIYIRFLSISMYTTMFDYEKLVNEVKQIVLENYIVISITLSYDKF